MLHVITCQTDPLLDLVRDDPVRPEIPSAMRVHDHAEIFVWLEAGRPAAVTCVSYCDSVPESVQDLKCNGTASVAAFYTIWSYAPGSARRLIRAAQAHIAAKTSKIQRFVTLSPKSEMARRFHQANGAITLRENADTVNYEYTV